MPGYIGYTPQFNPIGLQEYMYVPTMTINEYKEAEKEFNEYQDKVAAVEALAGNNAKAMNIVNQYKTYLGDAATGLANNGVKSAEGYRAAKKARDYYRDSVMKLEPAITAFQNAQKTRAAKDDGTLIGPELSLDTYIDNPLYQDRFVNGSAIQQEAMQAAAHASARRKSEKTPSKALGNQYWQLGTQMGFTPEEVNAWLTDPTSNPELTTIANQIAEKYGEYDMNKVGQYITRGILDGIAYDNKTSYQSNKAYDLQKQKELLDYKASLEGTKTALESTGVLSRRPANATQTKEQKELEKKVARFKELRQLITENPDIYDAQEPQRYLSSETTNIPKAVQIQQKGLNNPMINIYNPTATYTENPNYTKQKENYKIKQEYEKLKKELGQELSNQYPNEKLSFDEGTSYVTENFPTYGFGTGTKQTKVFNYNTNLDQYLDNLANLTSGYNYEVTPQEMRAITQNIWVNSGIGMEKGKTALDGSTDLILNEKGKPVKREKLKDLDRENTWIYIGPDGKHHFDYNGDTYTIMEEAIDNELGSQYFGDRDVSDINGNIMRAGRLREAWNAGQYDYYNQGVREFANRLVAATRARVPAAGGTSSTYNAAVLP